MIAIKTLVFNSFQENTYVLSDESGKCVIVDAGCNSDLEFDKLIKYISSSNLTPEKLLLTHGHVDHVLGAAKVCAYYKIETYAHKLEIDLIKSATLYGAAFGFNATPVPLISFFLVEGISINFGNSKLDVFHVPGHSKGSVALYSEVDKFVITGDVLFKGSIGRTDLPGGDYDVIMKSISTKLLTLPDDTNVFPGHGLSTTIGIEKKSNPFLIG